MSSYNRSHPVLLNVYDLNPLNKYMRMIGLGMYHSAIEVDGSEISFGGGDRPIGGSGISISEPLYKSNYQLMETRFVGVISSMSQVDSVIRDLEGTFMADHYHVIYKNCNHFTEEFCYRLLKKHIPSYVNRMAKVGAVIGCTPGTSGYSNLNTGNLPS